MDKYEPKATEEKWYQFWTDKGYFTAAAESSKPSFSIVIPPPNVTGALHMGHALNNTLQDILSRYKRATGYNVLWLPGCDHAGIATQNVVERELKKENLKRQDLGREKFLERVWEWKDKYGKTIMMQLRKLGSSCDWTRERFTMDEGLSAAVKEVFVRLYQEGLIYRGDYIVNWCPRCLTAISDIEVTHKDINGHFYHINYPYADGSGFIQVATTRPETLLGDTAVAVNPDDERYKNVKEGTMLILPETGRQIPIIKDSYVDKEFGTGAVKITPAHDPNDFEVGRRHGLEVINVMTENGKMNEKAGVNGKYAGMDRFECRKKIVENLKEQGLLVKIDDHKHAVGHCYRCDTVVEPYVSAQWFVKIKPLADEAIKAVEDGRVRFTPDMWKKVYFEWMNNIKDWCISRQLWWGHRIPAWYCECGEIIVAKDTPSKCPKCGGTKLRQDNDVLDTWFSSGLWPFSTLGWPEKTKELKTFYPTSVLVTSWDILFFWVARMIMMGLKFMGEVPFRDVCINSLVGDSEGKKMSKSKGNVVDPLDIMAKFSADSLRFTMAAIETQSRYIAFTEDRAKGYHSFMNKIFNASKYTIGNLTGMKEVSLEDNYCKLKLPEKWILDRVNTLGKKVGESIEKFRFSEPALAIYDFFWHEFCDWYIEISKIELAKPGDEEYKNLVKNVLLKVLKDSVVIMHPFIPFLTEEIYQNLPFAGRKESVMLENWPGYNAKFAAREAETAEMDEMMKLIYVIRNLRGELDFSPADKADIYVNMAANKSHILSTYNDVIRTLAKVGEVLKKSSPNFILRQVCMGQAAIGEIGIDVAAIKDRAKVVAGKEKRAVEIEKGIAAINRKLNDANFIKHAMPKLIEEEKARLDVLDAELKAVKALIEDLKKA